MNAWISLLRTLYGRGTVPAAGALVAGATTYIIAFQSGLSLPEIRELVAATGAATAASIALVDEQIRFSVRLHDRWWEAEIDLARQDYDSGRASEVQIAVRLAIARYRLQTGPGRKLSWAAKRALADHHRYEIMAAVHLLPSAIAELSQPLSADDLANLVSHLAGDAQANHKKLSFLARVIPGSRERATRRLLPPE
jgi:hypothetical protein